MDKTTSCTKILISQSFGSVESHGLRSLKLPLSCSHGILPKEFEHLLVRSYISLPVVFLHPCATCFDQRTCPAKTCAEPSFVWRTWVAIEVVCLNSMKKNHCPNDLSSFGGRFLCSSDLRTCISFQIPDGKGFNNHTCSQMTPI